MRTLDRAWGKTTKIVLVALVCLTLAGPAGWADPDIKTKAYQSLNATLYKKAQDEVVDTFGKHYTINRATLIIGTDGHQLTIGDLKVPCDVSLKIVDQGRGNPLAVRIKVLHLHPGANFQMEG